MNTEKPLTPIRAGLTIQLTHRHSDSGETLYAARVMRDDRRLYLSPEHPSMKGAFDDAEKFVAILETRHQPLKWDTE